MCASLLSLGSVGASIWGKARSGLGAGIEAWPIQLKSCAVSGAGHWQGGWSVLNRATCGLNLSWEKLPPAAGASEGAAAKQQAGPCWQPHRDLGRNQKPDQEDKHGYTKEDCSVRSPSSLHFHTLPVPACQGQGSGSGVFFLLFVLF